MNAFFIFLEENKLRYLVWSVETQLWRPAFNVTHGMSLQNLKIVMIV